MRFPQADGDYEVRNGFALVDGDDPEAYGLAAVSGSEQWGGFGLYADDSDDDDAGYPLGADVDFPDDGFNPVDDYGQYDAGGYDDGYDDGYDAPAGPEQAPVTQVDAAELAQVLAQRQQMIADAQKQGVAQTQRVNDLDAKLANDLNPQYQQAVGAGEKAKATALAGQIRVLGIQRTAAMQKAQAWARFASYAAQLAKNAQAQVALQRLFWETQQEDPGTAAQVARTYQEIGAATAQIRQAQARQTLNDAADKLHQAQQALAAQQQQLVAILKATPEARMAPSAKVRLDALRARIAQLKAAHRTQAEVVKQAKLAAMAAGMQFDAQGAERVGFQGLGDTIPFCAVYTRDAYGPTCAQETTMDLGGFGEFGSWWETGAEVAAASARAVADEVKRREAEKRAKAAAAGMPVVVAGPVYTPPMQGPWYTRSGPVLAVALIAGGVIGGVYLASQPARGGLQGLSRRRRRGHRGRR